MSHIIYELVKLKLQQSAMAIPKAKI